MNNKLGKAKAVLITSMMLMGEVTYAENIPVEIQQQNGYDRWFNVSEKFKEEKNPIEEQIGYDRWFCIIDTREEDEKPYVEINVELTFYTSLVEENTSLGGIDAQGNPLIWGTIAVPREVKLGTKFEIEGYDNIFVARDRGSIKHIRIKEDGTYRIDLFVPRKSGENNKSYWKRVNNYGKITRKAKIYTE